MGPCNYKITVNGKELTLNEHELKGYLLKEGLTKFSKELSLEKPKVTVSTPIIKNIKLKENAESLRSNEGQVQPTGDELRRSTEQSSSDIQRNEEIPSGYGETKQQAGIGAKEEGHGEGKKETVKGNIPPSMLDLPVSPEPGETTVLHHAATEENRGYFGMQQRTPREVKKDIALEAEAEEKIKSGYDINKLIEKGLKGQLQSDLEHTILKKYAGGLEQRLNRMSHSDPEFDKIFNEVQRVYEASEKAGSELGAAFRARRGEILSDESLAGLLLRKKSATNKKELSSEDKAKIVEQHTELEDAKKNYEETLLKGEQKHAEQIVQKLKSDRPKQKKSHEQYVKDREKIISSIKDKLRKSRGELSAVPLPYVKELVAISPDVLRLVKSLVDEGVDKLSDLVTQIHPLVKESIPDVTEKDVLDLISGKYKETQKPRKLSEEEIAAKDRLIKIKQEIEVSILKDEYANRTKAQKVKDAALEVLNVPRTIMSSFDLSAPLRQGLIPSISHPGAAGKAFVEMLRQAVSQKRFDRWFFDLRESPAYKVMEESGLYVSDPHDYRLSAKEEAFMNNLAEKIPVAGKIIKGSERAYVSYLNKMRVDLFRQGVGALHAMGKTFENNKSDFEALASWVNNSTGRGGLGKIGERAAPVLNTAFFSPRLIASRLNLLNPLYYTKLPKSVRVMALKDMAKFIAFGTSVLGLAKLSGADVEDDPRSSDFGKIKVGNTRYDIWGGFQQYARLAAQLFSGEAKSIRTGKIRELSGEGAFGESRIDVLNRFVRTKLAPIPSITVDFLSGRTVVGEPVTVQSELEKNMLPLIYSDVKDALKDKGIKALFTVAIPASLGVGVQTYEQKPVIEKRGTKKVKKHSKKQ